MSNSEKVIGVAKAVIKKCGGAKRTAGIVGRNISWVYRWTYSKERSGTGGVVPHADAQKLLEAASRGEVNLTAEDFFETVEQTE